MTYHNNTDIGITTWSTEQQCYYLIPFSRVNAFFKELSTQITVSPELVDNAFNFLSDYDPETEIVLLTLNEELLTIAVLNKYEPPSREAISEQLDWPLDKVYAFCYLEKLNKSWEIVCQALDISPEEYDTALNLILA